MIELDDFQVEMSERDHLILVVLAPVFSAQRPFRMHWGDGHAVHLRGSIFAPRYMVNLVSQPTS